MCHTCIISCAALACKDGIPYSVAMYLTKSSRWSFSIPVPMQFVHSFGKTNVSIRVW